jgi:hypothetical protein
LEASKRATERALQILKQSAKGTKPSDAARLLVVGDAIGRAALGLSWEPTAQTGHFGLRPTGVPNIRVVLRMDSAAQEHKRREDAFFAAHPELRRPKNGLEDAEIVTVDDEAHELRPSREID